MRIISNHGLRIIPAKIGIQKVVSRFGHTALNLLIIISLKVGMELPGQLILVNQDGRQRLRIHSNFTMQVALLLAVEILLKATNFIFIGDVLDNGR